MSPIFRLFRSPPLDLTSPLPTLSHIRLNSTQPLTADEVSPSRVTLIALALLACTAVVINSPLATPAYQLSLLLAFASPNHMLGRLTTTALSLIPHACGSFSVLPNVHESPAARKSLPQKSIPPRASREERPTSELSSKATGLATAKNGTKARRVMTWSCMLTERLEDR